MLKEPIIKKMAEYLADENLNCSKSCPSDSIITQAFPISGCDKLFTPLQKKLRN